MGQGTCSIDGCTRAVRSRGWCSTHYQRWQNHGDPEYVEQIRGDDVARFLSKVDRRGDDECWPFTDHTNTTGYGKFGVGGKMVSAHVYAYGMFVGPIPEGYEVDHLCHDPKICHLVESCPHRACVNWLRHLKPATHRENSLRSGAVPARNAIKTHCDHDHEFTLENTQIRREGGRKCRACKRKNSKT